MADARRVAPALFTQTFPCRALFFGASIITVPPDFRDDPREPANAPTADRGVRQPVEDTGEDSLDFAEPAEPPRGLMRKRPHVAVWILAALLLGGLIALILVGIASD
jgi:hypothetical protein